MAKVKSGNILPVLLVPVAVIALAVAGYLYFQNQSLKSQFSFTPSTQPENSPIEPRIPTTGETANWKIYSDNKISFKYPESMSLGARQVHGSGTFQELKDANGIYILIFDSQGNYNQETGQPFKSLNEFVKISYGLNKKTVGGREAIQVLPRAGSESDFGVSLFSKDDRFVYSLILSTPRDGSRIQEGQRIFDQILSTFKFL